MMLFQVQDHVPYEFDARSKRGIGKKKEQLTEVAGPVLR